MYLCSIYVEDLVHTQSMWDFTFIYIESLRVLFLATQVQSATGPFLNVEDWRFVILKILMKPSAAWRVYSGLRVRRWASTPTHLDSPLCPVGPSCPIQCLSSSFHSVTHPWKVKAGSTGSHHETFFKNTNAKSTSDLRAPIPNIAKERTT